MVRLYNNNGGSGGSALTVTDGTTTVNNVSNITFLSGAVVSNGGGGIADVAISGASGGTVTTVSVASANGFAGTVATATTTPVITISTSITGILLGDGTAVTGLSSSGTGNVVRVAGATLTTPTLGVAAATTINKVTLTAPATGSTLTIDDGFTLHVTGNVTALSGSSTGTNTGDQTTVSGNAGTATALQTARTIGGVSFDGTANITVATATGGFTVSGGALALGANSITMSGSIGVTGTRVTKLWATDIESTNIPTFNGTAMVGKATTDVFTNKTMIATSNVVEEATTTASSATPTPTGGSLRNFFTVTALAAAAAFAAPSGSPVDGNYLTIRIKDNATARALTWNSIYRAGSDVALPSTTVISKTMYLALRYNGADSKWDLLAITNNI